MEAGPIRLVASPHADAEDASGSASANVFALWFDALREAEAGFVWGAVYAPEGDRHAPVWRSEADSGLEAGLGNLVGAAAQQRQLKISVVNGAGSAPRTAMAAPAFDGGEIAFICVAIQNRKLIEATRATPLFEAAVGQLPLARASAAPSEHSAAPEDSEEAENAPVFSARDCLDLLAVPPAEFHEAVFDRFMAGLLPMTGLLAHVRANRIKPLRSSQKQDLLPQGSRVGQARRAALFAAAARDEALLVSSGGQGGAPPVNLDLDMLLGEAGIAGAVSAKLPHPKGGHLVFLAEYEAETQRPRDDALVPLSRRLDAFSPTLDALRSGKKTPSFFARLPVWLDPRGIRPWLLAGLAALAVWLALPAPFQIVGEATLRAGDQQAVVAPRDGYLVAARARAGEIVREGDIIAEFDTRELVLRRARILAQIEQAQGRRLTAIAAFNTAMVQVSDAEIRALIAERDLVDLLLEQSRIVADADVVVVSGDMTERVGSAMRRGEMMFQLAPLDGLVAAIDIPQKDVNEAVAGQLGELKLTALPFETFPLAVDRVTLTSDAETGAPAFFALADIGAEHDAFRPGMQGVAHIHAGEAPRVWILTRDLVFWLRMQWWRWVP